MDTAKTAVTPWYETAEAKSLLIRAALGDVEWKRHYKTYVITSDEWYTAEGPVGDRLHEIADDHGDRGYAAEYPKDGSAGEAGAFLRSGFTTSVENAIRIVESGTGRFLTDDRPDSLVALHRLIWPALRRRAKRDNSRFDEVEYWKARPVASQAVAA